jgi:hypothetical protein
VQVPASVLAAYQSVNNAATATAATPFQTYGSPGATNADGSAQQFVAPVNSTQQQGITGTTAAANEAQPGYTAAQNTLGTAQSGTTGINDAATGLAAASAGQVNATPLTGADVNQYLSPYLGDVLGTTDALENQNNSVAQSGALGTAISSGAFGSDRTGIAAANLNQQNELAENATNANILNTGYNTALGTAQQQQGVNLSAGQANRAALASSGSELASIGQTAYGEGANTASEEGALASGAQTAGLQGANAEIAAGTVQQQTAQAQDTAEYNQFLQQQSYPFQVDAFLANIAEGTGALSGSTTTTTQPGGFFSDRRLKHDIKKIGETFDKQTIYSYKMHGDDRTHIGLMAQDVEKKRPRAVGVDPGSGYKMVDYGVATEKAANRGHFYEGGVVPMRRVAKAGGGPSIVDAGDLSAILQAQQGMYAPMSGGASGVYGGVGGSVPRGGSSRVPAPEGAVPHLVTAQGGLRAPTTGVQNLASAANLYKEGKGIYDDTRPVRKTVTTTAPGGLAPANMTPVAEVDDTEGPPTPSARGGRRGYDDGGDVDFDSLAAAHGAMYGQGQKGSGVDIPSGGGQSHQLAVASGTPQPAPSGGSNLNTGLGVVQKGQQIYNKMNAPNAPPSGGLGDTSGLEQGATSASAPAADSGTISGISSPAAAPAADAGATSAAAGAGSGAAAGAAGDAAAGAAGAAAADAGGTAAAEAAAAIAAEYAAADVGTVALLAAKRGGRIRKGYDAGGMPYSSDDGSLDIPDTSSGASALKTAGPLQKQPTGLQTLETLGTEQGAQGAISGMFSNQALKRGGVAGRRGYADGGDPDDTDNTDAGPSTAAPGLAAADTSAPAAKDSGLKMDSGPSWWDRNKGKAIPLLEGLAAMGTAPTKHLGVALAAGLGSAAGSYVPVNEGLANTRQTEAQTNTINIQNQIAQMKANAAQAYLNPTAPATSTPPKKAADAATNIADQYRQKYFVQPYTPDEQGNIQKALKASMVLGDAPVKTAMAARDQRVANQTAQNTNDAQAEADQLYTQATDPAASDAAKQAALVQYNAVHQWTGDKYEDQAGVMRNSRTGQPPIGVARQVLTPEQAFQQWHAMAGPTDTGAPAKIPFATYAKQQGINLPPNWAPPTNTPPPAAPVAAAPQRQAPAQSPPATSAPPATIAPGAAQTQQPFSDAPQKPSWLDNPNAVLTDYQKKVSDNYQAKEAALRDDANSVPQTQAELVKAQRVLNLLKNTKTGPGVDTMSTVQTALGNMTGSQFVSWMNSNPAAYALLQKQLGQSALDERVREMSGAGAQVKLGAQTDNLILNKLSASAEMPKAAITGLIQQHIQQTNYDLAREQAIPQYLKAGKDAREFDNYYSTKNDLRNSLSTAAPSGTTVPRPGVGEGDIKQSKSGRAMVFTGGQWRYQ